MNKGRKETITIRIVSSSFVALALAVFKPFGLDSWHWQAYIHLMNIFLVGVIICIVTDIILKYIVRMPRSYEKGVSYIIRRNLYFQLINTPFVALAICLYRHFILSDRVESNQLSWINFFETLLIIAFCSFAIGLYWRFKFRSRYLAAELEETRLLNEQLQHFQAQSRDLHKNGGGSQLVDEDFGDKKLSHFPLSAAHEDSLILTGTTNETVSLQVSELLYIEAVGNYVKVYHLIGEQVRNDMLRATSKQIEEELRNYPMIVRCHRAFLVNLGQVDQIIAKAGKMQLLMKNCQESIPVSRSNMAQIKESIQEIAL
jgi:hypothetical protein